MLVATSSLSVFSTVTLLTVLLTISLRPVWCPQTLCPHPRGTYDQSLEVELTTVRSPAFLMTEPAAAYSLQRLPPSDGPAAVAADRLLEAGQATPSQSPLQLVVRVHSLRSSGPATFVEAVWLLLNQVSPLPEHLVPVWLKGANTDFQAHPYRALYTGEQAGDRLRAAYVGPSRDRSVSLLPGESDELSVALGSTDPVRLRLQVQVEYRLGEEQGHRTLTLRNLPGAVFVDQLRWDQYRLKGDRLVRG
jgi:hypothetical protein